MPTAGSSDGSSVVSSVLVVVCCLQTGIVSISSISKGGKVDVLSSERKGKSLSLKITLREMMIFLVTGSHSRYALAPLSYPTSTHRFDFGDSFVSCADLRSGYAAHPMARRKSVLLECDPCESSCQSL